MMFEGVSILPIEIIILIGLALFVLLLLVWRYRRRVAPGSLGNRLLLAFIGVAAISVILVVSIVIWWTRQELTRRTGESFEALAEANSARLVEELSREIELLQELAENPTIYTWLVKTSEEEKELSLKEQVALRQAREKAWAEWQDSNLYSSVQANPAAVRMSAFVSRFSTQKQLVLVDQYGGLVAVGGGLPTHYYYGDEAWWQETWVQGGGRVTYISNYEVKPDDQEAIIEIAVPVKAFGTYGLPHGMLYSQLPVRNLNIFADVSSAGQEEAVDLALVNKDGQILYSSDPSRIGKKVTPDFQDDIVKDELGWAKDKDETGQSIIHSHARLELSPQLASLEELGWTIVVQQPETEALGVVRTLSQFALFGGLAALVLAIVVAVWISRQLARPIENLTDIATSMVAGQLEQAAPASGPAELRTLAQSFNSMTEQLRQMLTGLEQRVAERTRRLEIVAALGERLSAILKLETLLAEVVNRIQESFGYYYAHIYLFDDKRENLVVTAGTGEAGAEMKAEGHSIPLNAQTSLVARAARTGQIVRVDNVRETEDWLPNPLLPNTYSEMAVPIILSAEEQVVGVLDVQEDEIAGLDEGDAALLRSLANQVAVAIQNAHLFAEVETALAEAREVQRRFVEQAWDRSQVVRRGRGRVQFSLGESTTLSETALTQARQQALAQQGPAVVTINGDEQESGSKEVVGVTHHALVSPITLGETKIGNLQLHGVDAKRKWAENELALINAVVDQVAQVAENLRLLNETQERASREQLIGQISDKLRRAPDIETLMKIAVAELSRVLDPDRTFGSAAEVGVTQAEKPSSDKFSGLEVEDQVEGDSIMDAELEFGVVQIETPGSSEPAELEAADQSEADSTLPSEARLDLAQEEELCHDEPSEAEAPVQPEDEFTPLPEDSVEPVDNEAEQEEEITSHAVND
jgi:GAF domain-containing protein/HAMP domain-containing protein